MAAVPESVTVKPSWNPPLHELVSDHAAVQPVPPVGLEDAEADGDAEADADALGLALGEADALGLALGLALGDAEALGEAEAVGVAPALGLALADPAVNVTTVTEYGATVWDAALPLVPEVIAVPGSASVETDGAPVPGVNPE